MKNTKREITLNEADSLFDMLMAEQGLLQEYCLAARLLESKSARQKTKENVGEIMDEIFFLKDLVAERKTDEK